MWSIYAVLTRARPSLCPLKTTDIQEKLDFEIRMREGAYKLLLACSKREQVLNASKNLLTCNARIKAYLTQLQKKSEEQSMMGAAGRLGIASLLFFYDAQGIVHQRRAELFRILMIWRKDNAFGLLEFE